MSIEPSISVIIPSYNSARWVAEAADSALSQTLQPAQIIVVDDGSTDDTAQVLMPYVARGAIEYVFQENRGVAAARNRGIARATGELIAFLDADDVWHPRKLELQSAVLSQHPDLGMLGTAVFDWPGAVPDVQQLGDTDVELVEWTNLIVRNYVVTSSVLVRRALLEKLGMPPFDTELHGPEDYDLWLRIADRCIVGNLPARLTGYREVVGSLGKQASTMERGVSRVLSKAAQRGAWTKPGGSRLRRRAYAYFHYSCAYMHGAAGNQWLAISRVLKSMFVYPFPLAAIGTKGRLARPKLLAVALLRLTGARSQENA